MTQNIRDHSDKGFTIVTSSAAITASEQHYYGIIVLEAAEIDSITFSPDYSGDAGIAGLPLPAGIYIPMRFTALALTSGTVLATKL